MIQCWRCREEFKKTIPGIAVDFSVLVSGGLNDVYMRATIPQPICPTCLGSFVKWCNKYAKKGCPDQG